MDASEQDKQQTSHCHHSYGFVTSTEPFVILPQMYSVQSTLPLQTAQKTLLVSSVA